MPIACGGALVMPGDVIVGDEDGVLVLPAALAEQVAHDALAQESREAWALERVQAGESVRGVYPLSEARREEYEAWRRERMTPEMPHEPIRRRPRSAIRGAITPLITPFTPMARSTSRRSRGSSTGSSSTARTAISVGGSTGEPTSQTVAERIAVMRAAAAAIDGRVPFLPGTGSARLDETLELTAEAQRLGRQRRARRRPRTTPARSRQGLFSWYSRVAARVSATFRSSSTTSRSAAAVDIAPETVGRLRRAHDNIVGIKETTRDFEHVSYVLHECGSDFIALSGIELLCYPMLVLGGRGHLSCVANFAPRAGGRALRRIRSPATTSARATLHYELHALVDAAFVEVNPVPAKWIMRELGIMPSPSPASRSRRSARPRPAKIRELLPEHFAAATAP